MAVAEENPPLSPFSKGGLGLAKSLPLFEKACPEHSRREGLGEILVKKEND